MMKRLIAILLLSVFPLLAIAQTTATGNLKGRSIVGSLPKPAYEVREAGFVVVRIKVDQYGNVTEAVPGVEGTTITDEGLWKACRSSASMAHFNASADAPVIQTGTITFKFEASETPEGQDDSDVLKFLGIPVDGSKEQMIERLKEKGFSGNWWEEYLEGIFNGEKVRVYIGTNHGIVDRIKVIYPSTDDRVTKVKYNTLLSRFGRNSKYTELRENREISENERISFEITVQGRIYDAMYYVLQSDIDAASWKEDFYREYKARYKKPLSELTQEEVEEVLFCLPSRIPDAVSGVVWFTLQSARSIVLYYDNLKNRPRGEDL